jgi:hypothetical protein
VSCASCTLKNVQTKKTFGNRLENATALVSRFLSIAMPTPKPKRKTKSAAEGDYQESKPHQEEGGAVRIHEAYLEHRLGGGEAATPEAYRRAVEQFQKLPGAMRSVPPAAPLQTPETEAEKPETDDKKGE